MPVQTGHHNALMIQALLVLIIPLWLYLRKLARKGRFKARGGEK